MSGFAIVDLFAGPGGLAEGFSSVRTENGEHPFSVVLSVEKEVSAHATLRLRSFLRQFDQFPKEYYQFLNGEIAEPDWGAIYPKEWRSACDEALNLELGTKEAIQLIDTKLDAIKAKHGGNIILIGGPPCQAYSLVGRARNKGVVGYNASDDHRHFLYREYIRILDRLRPAVFVMENVKGMLSSVVDGEGVFDKVLKDLRLSNKGHASYQLITIAPRTDNDATPRSKDFIVRTENYGLPQARHRVIVVGIRNDIADGLDLQIIREGILGNNRSSATVRDVLEGMPRLRSGLSKSKDSDFEWRSTVSSAIAKVLALPTGLSKAQAQIYRARIKEYALALKNGKAPKSRTCARPVGINSRCPYPLKKWLLDSSLKSLPNNEARGHMPSDLARYFFAAIFGEVAGVSPKASHYPDNLAPDHKNWTTGKFADRFRVQLWDHPSTTVTCHISKDGHYFIHPDPLQCRSLTVREAARLQTFPDNYYFKGNRTQQYVQVGNAVPPYLAKQIAEALHSILIQSLKSKRIAGIGKKYEKDKFSKMQFRIAANMK